MNLYYEVSGNGKPIVFIHSGGGADLREWTYLAPLLSQRYQAITYDGRGAGKSPDPTGDVSCVEDVKSLLDHLEIKKATVVGRSMGGDRLQQTSL
ncbi:alpha/beta fold hydrolase [Gracilibacillus sp. JCM 18860]|uniref:alpha/beta fold hydrolase n=1 Tax=Gracilibacillus sp. JCM 18860 TaxID=1306159 RepID=UPI000B31004B